MSSRRSQQVARQIKEELGWIVEHKFRDPQKGFLTLTKVRISPDLKIANVYFSVLGNEDERKASEEALSRAKSFLKYELGNRINLRFLPELRFFYDDSLEYSEKISKLINKIHKDDDH